MESKKIKNIKFAATVSISSAIGTGIYQLFANPEIAFDVYKPIFVGLFTFVIAAIGLAVTPQKDD